MLDSQTVKTDVQNKLLYDPSFDSDGVNIAEEAGIVTLSGRVKHYYDKYAAEEAARAARGVKGVVNELQVDLHSSLERSDHDIAVASVRALEWDVSLPQGKIQVSVESGAVKLTGEVEFFYQKERAARDVVSLRGVKNVINYISIRNVQSSISPQAVSEKIKKEFQRTALLDSKNIQVETGGSGVVLKGFVRSWAESTEAAKAAWAVPGVTEVDNQLHIRYENGVSL